MLWTTIGSSPREKVNKNQQRAHSELESFRLYRIVLFLSSIDPSQNRSSSCKSIQDVGNPNRNYTFWWIWTLCFQYLNALRALQIFIKADPAVSLWAIPRDCSQCMEDWFRRSIEMSLQTRKIEQGNEMHMETKLGAYVLGISLPSSIDRKWKLFWFFLLPKERYPVCLEELIYPFV